MAATPNRYLFSLKERRLTKGDEIKVSGNFSGLYHGVVRVNLLTDDGETVFRIAMR